MKISGHTEPYAVLGHPIGHSLSPVMHNASFQALARDAIYLALDVAPERLSTVLSAMGDMGFCGVNLTIPHKEVAFRSLSLLDTSAKLFGAVNTVEFTPDGPKGHNTDGWGFLQAVQEAFDTTVADKDIFVLGSGGAGRTVALMSAYSGAKSVTVSDLDFERSQTVVHEIEKLETQTTAGCCGSAEESVARARVADMVIQATPVGMRSEDHSPLPPEAFIPTQLVFDLIYMFPETAFLRTASEQGAQISNGLGMLLHQGARAFSIWTGQTPAISAMRAALENEVYK